MSNSSKAKPILRNEAQCSQGLETLTKVGERILDLEKLASVVREECRSAIKEVLADVIEENKFSIFPPKSGDAEISQKRIYNEEDASEAIGKNKQYLRSRFCKIGQANIGKAIIDVQFPRFLKSGQSRRYLGRNLIAFQKGLDPERD